MAPTDTYLLVTEDAHPSGVPDEHASGCEDGEVQLLDLVLGSGAADAPDEAPAVITTDITVSRGELRDTVNDLGRAVASITAPGDRIVLASDNVVETLALLIGIPTAGRTVVPLNTRGTVDDAWDLVSSVGARVLIGTAEELARLGPPPSTAPSITTTVGLDPGAGDISLSALTTASEEGPPPGPAADTDPAWIVFTSGTTGRPKGAVLSARTLGAAVRSTAAGRPLADDDIYLYPFPLHHISAYNVLHALHRSCPVVLARRFDAEEFISLTDAHRVTTTSLAPTMLRMLLDRIADRGAERVATLRTISYGAAPMPPALLREAEAALGVGFAQGYGMTELSGNAVFLSPEHHRRGLAGEDHLLRAAGWPAPGIEVAVVDETGSPVSPGVSGEVIVRGDQVCAGYWDDPEATSAAIREGWLHTGDVGRLDQDGMLTLVDRLKDVIITGGENVASREVEEAVAEHPDVARVAVIGLPDATWGEAVVAAVVLRPDVKPSDEVAQDIRKTVRGRLAGYKVPKRVLFTADLPQTASGKFDKRRLRKDLTEADEGADAEV